MTASARPGKAVTQSIAVSETIWTPDQVRGDSCGANLAYRGTHAIPPRPGGAWLCHPL